MIIDSAKYGGLCKCGKEHQMATRLCVIEPGALSDFETYMARLELSGKRCVVYDTNTYYIPELIRPAADQEVILPAEGLHADEVSTAKLTSLMDLARLQNDLALRRSRDGGGRPERHRQRAPVPYRQRLR